MQKNIFQIILLAVIVLFSSGCEDYLGGDTNIDPNKTNDASLNTLLPTILYYTAQSTASNASISSQYIQQIGSLVASGSDAQLRNTFDGQWSNLYLSILPNANIIIEKSTANNAPHYAGIAKIVIAYNLGLATATWENVPYSQADNQLTNLYPAYDTQESVYASAISLIDQGIQDLSATESLFKPGTDDIVYKGSTDKWIKLGYTLKARYLLHLASKGGNYSPSQVLDALANGMKSNSEDFQLVYTDRNFNPWYAVALANNTGNLTTTFGGFFMDLMNGTVQGVVDPRVSLIAYRSGTDSIYHGTLAGAGSGANTAYNNKTSFFGWYNDLLSPLQMVTYSEAKFIEAEAEMMKNGGNANDAAYTAYLDGIKANLSKIGV
ncbi:MAG: SusD/RagB family nutrient-binding outer membrane lipoprotein, partial [Saprospiraceae bacterium]|nr:SusD/RagB family nutrient-binding outer membrane lipoprotein [Saprospiraceae bacterium]